MSQRGPASRPASRRASKSPPQDASTSSPPSALPSSQRHLAPRDDQRPTTAQQQPDRGDRRGVRAAAAEEGGQQHQQQQHHQGGGPRTSGVHNILNPSDHRQVYGEAITTPGPHPSHPPQEIGSPWSSGTARGGYGAGSPPHPYAYHGHQPPPLAPQPTRPPPPPSTSMPSGAVASSMLERGSPTAGPAYSPVGAASRRILTPKSPRATSLGRAAMRAAGSPRPPMPQQGPGQGSRAASLSSPHDNMAPRGGGGHGRLGGPAQLHPGPELPSTTTPPPARSLSQPIAGHALPSGHHPHHHHEHRHSHSAGRPPVLTSSTAGGGHYSSPMPPGRGLPTAGGPSGDGRWATNFLGQMAPGLGGGRGVPVEGQHLLTITPPHGEEILVPVDVHQASKQADEKRLRNAGASARFRLRKKEKEKEQQAGMQKLESANRELEKRIRDLEAQCEYYRGERNRLRDLVARTPSISEWADRGPPSPALLARPPLPPESPFSAESSSAAAAAAAAQTTTLTHPPPSPYPTSDPSMLERPARRRRTDSEAQFASSSYAAAASAAQHQQQQHQQQPTSLPPIPPSAYGLAPSTPRASGSPGSARLPPLRMDQPSSTPDPVPGAPAVAPPPLPGQQPQPPYTPYGRPPSYDPGWATGQRGPHDGSQR